MDAQELVSGLRWDLLQHIAKQPSTGADLARAFGTSPANITQHLKLLELGGLVQKERVNGKSMHYKLHGELALVTVLANPAVRATVPLRGVEKLYLQLLMTPNNYAQILKIFVAQYEELIEGFVGFGIIAHDHDIQLLVLSHDVKLLRREYANIHIKNKKIVIWSHTPEEFREGLQRHEAYFREKLRTLTILYDPNHVLARLAEEYHE
jgi:DNA-binding transcriptional ArsR family regulator